MIVRISDAALDDLVGVLLDGVRKFGRKRADQYLLEMKAAMEALGEFPQAFAERPDIGSSVRSRAFRAHIILYRVEDDCLRVLRIRHSHEDWQ